MADKEEIAQNNSIINAEKYKRRIKKGRIYIDVRDKKLNCLLSKVYSSQEAIERIAKAICYTETRNKTCEGCPCKNDKKKAYFGGHRSGIKFFVGGTQMKKVYLETPEAVIKALKEGKEVRDKYGSICKLVDGIIISKLNNFFEIGKPIRSVNKPYILEEEPLKIEVGKWYEMRNHNVARCYNAEGDRRWFSIDNGGVFKTDSEGYFKCKDKPYDLDIIANWKEDK